MPQNQHEVEAKGEVGKVYTTKTGMEKADVYIDDCGWEQINTTQRVLVRSERDDLPVHSIWRIWKR